MNRFVVFDPVADALVHVGQAGGPQYAYNQSALNFEPRVGFAWDVRGDAKTVIRSAYAIFTDQPTAGLVTSLASNPPYSIPVQFSPTKTVPFVTLANAYQFASGSISPTSVAHGYKNANVQSWNFNLEQQLASNYGLRISYVGSKGSDLNIARNYNQPVNGVRPYRALSANSIDAGLPLGNITVYESVANSSYQALWVTVQKRYSAGLQFSGSYTWSKSIDENSRNIQGVVVQDSYNLHGDRGLSDYDARHRFVLSAVYDLPFHSNKFVDGWQLSLIQTLQSGNPINFHTNFNTLTGAGTLRPVVNGPVVAGYSPATNRSATFINYVSLSAFPKQGNVFGNLGRNVVIGPGFENLDFSLVKNVKLYERATLQIRGDAFDLLNQTNFGQPNSTLGSSTFGLINNTRFPTGDSGSSRQLQLALKLLF